MEISKLLQKLFLTQDSVSIGSFGTLRTKEISAQIKGNEILPPTKKISFHSKIEENVPSLKSILIQEGLTEADAQKQIDEFVSNIKKTTDKGEKYEIKDFGYFYKDEKGFLQFECVEDFNLHTEALGLTSVKMTQTESSNRKKKEKKKKNKEKVTADNVKLTNAVKKTKEKKPKDKEKKKKLTKSLLIALPIILIVVLIGIFHQPIIEKSKNIFKKSSKENVTKNDNNVRNDTNVADVNPQLGNDEEYKKLLDAHISNMADVYIGDNYKKFYIIVGSYSIQQNADDFAKQLKNMGYSPQIINGPTYYRVSVGAYNTADNLIKDYKQFSSKFNTKTWILVNRKK